MSTYMTLVDTPLGVLGKRPRPKNPHSLRNSVQKKSLSCQPLFAKSGGCSGITPIDLPAALQEMVGLTLSDGLFV